MKPLYHFLLIMCVILVGGCSAIAGIFKAGMWTGILIVVLVVGVIIWLITKSGNKQ
jgi:cytosine/uracil/thiamine/allantoin permease